MLGLKLNHVGKSGPWDEQIWNIEVTDTQFNHRFDNYSQEPAQEIQTWHNDNIKNMKTWH